MNLYAAKAPFPFLKGLIRDNRPTWFFEETGLPYNRIALDPLKGETRTEDYTRLNRFQKIPSLEAEGFVVTQSAAILHHLASTTGKLYPRDPREQTKHMEWMFYCMSDVEAHAVQIGTLLKFTDEKDHAHARWMVARAETLLTRALNYLEGELAGKTYLMGDEFYAADILLGCCLLPVADHELVQSRGNIKRLMETYRARPAFRRAMDVNGV